MKLFLATPLLASSTVVAGALDSALDEKLAISDAGEIVSTLVFLEEQVDLAALDTMLADARLGLRARHEQVVQALRDTALDSQGAVLSELEARKQRGGELTWEAFWIANVFRLDATPAVIRAVASHADVSYVSSNPRIERVAPPAPMRRAGSGGMAGAEPGLIAIGAPEAWALGYTGAGVLVASLDTGVNGSHPALADRWRGLDPAYADHPEWAFFDPLTGWTFPQDSSIQGHGTHTMGTICGGPPGDSIGVAPDAEWIHGAILDRIDTEQTVADAMLAFQWIVDPDGDPWTSTDVPAVCSNSWALFGPDYPECDDLLWSFLDACEAAGVVIVFAAGSAGTSGLGRPADRATDDYRTFAVGAVDGNVPGFPVADFSSRGPTFCGPDGAEAIKPDIAAPGVHVRSALPGNAYGFLTGTSMATPHVAGSVALVRQANPLLTVQQIKQVLFDTALDLGRAGEDNEYGHGLVNAGAAVQQAYALLPVDITFPDGLPDLVEPAGGETLRMLVLEIAAGQIAGTGKVFHRSGGGAFVELAMTEIDDNLYEAQLPGFACGSEVEFYFSVDADSGDTVLSPFNAPEKGFLATAYSGLAVGFADSFETDQGWTVTSSPDLIAGAWERGVPVGGGDRGDPPVDGDGSGQCFLTENVDGDSDVDGGSTTLTSPIMDATAIADATISFQLWYSNVAGSGPEQDTFLIEGSDDAGRSWVTLDIVGPGGPQVQGGWEQHQYVIADFVEVTDQFRIRFTASDTFPPSVVEAGIDAVQIEAFYCYRCEGDANLDGVVDVDDLIEVTLNFGPCSGCPADMNGDGVVDVDDQVLVILNWGNC